MTSVFKKPEGDIGPDDVNGVFRFDPVDNAQKRKWLKYADGVYEPVRNDGNLKRKKDDYRQFQWWQVDKPADWKPQDEGADFSWNHTLGSKADLADQTTGKPLAAKRDQPKEEKPQPVQPKLERPKSPGRHDGFPSWQSLLAKGGAAAEEPAPEEKGNAQDAAAAAAGGAGSGMVQSKGQSRMGKASGNDPLLKEMKKEFEDVLDADRPELKRSWRRRAEKMEEEAKHLKGKKKKKLENRARQLRAALKILTDGRFRPALPLTLFNKDLLERMLKYPGMDPSAPDKT